MSKPPQHNESVPTFKLGKWDDQRLTKEYEQKIADVWKISG